MKRCSICGQMKDRQRDFRWRRDKRSNGYYPESLCHECKREQDRQRQAKARRDPAKKAAKREYFREYQRRKALADTDLQARKAAREAERAAKRVVQQQKKREHEAWLASTDAKATRRKHRKRWNMANRNRAKEWIEAEKERRSGCFVCGYDRCKDALEFHHLNADEKKDSISSLYTMRAIKDEASKCVLLCANCHRETHAGMTSIDYSPPTEAMPPLLVLCVQD